MINIDDVTQITTRATNRQVWFCHISFQEFSDCMFFVCLFVFFTNLLQPSTFYLSPILHKMSKRDVTLLDRSEKSVRVTLWGDYVSKSLSNQSLLMALAVLYVPDL